MDGSPLDFVLCKNRWCSSRSRTEGRQRVVLFDFRSLALPCNNKQKQDNMIIPVRCFTCGKVIGNKWETYLSLLQADFSEGYGIRSTFDVRCICLIRRTSFTYDSIHLTFRSNVLQ
jgi:DNA-directed RNA polymerase subunit N (RpoN/RPB10)